MKAIVVVAYNRPDCLLRCIETIRQNNTSGWVLFFGVDPGNDEVVQICRSVTFMPIMVQVHSERIRQRENTKRTISMAFSTGAEGVLYLQDDMLSSPDLTMMAEWFFQTGHPYELLCPLHLPWLRTNNPEKTDVVYSCGPVYGSWTPFIRHAHPISGTCFAISARKWQDRFLPRWADGGNFDKNLARDLIKTPEARVLMPAFSRTQHIGDTSSIDPMSPFKLASAAIFASHKWYQGPPVPYRIEDYPGSQSLPDPKCLP